MWLTKTFIGLQNSRQFIYKKTFHNIMCCAIAMKIIITQSDIQNFTITSCKVISAESADCPSDRICPKVCGKQLYNNKTNTNYIYTACHIFSGTVSNILLFMGFFSFFLCNYTKVYYCLDLQIILRWEISTFCSKLFDDTIVKTLNIC